MMLENVSKALTNIGLASVGLAAMAAEQAGKAGKILAETLGGFAADILAVKNNPSLSGIVDADDGAAQSGFATAGLAYQAQGLAPLHLNGDIVHRLDHSAAADAEIFLEIFCLKNDILTHF